MPRVLQPSLPHTNPQLSHAINLFLHKDRTSFFDDDSIASGSIAPFELQAPLVESPIFNWDLQSTCTTLIPAFQYISSKLHQRGLSIALIISEQDPYFIPVWPLSRKSQIILAQIVRKAVRKFSLQPSWLTALASASNKCLPKVFDTYRPDSYIVRRSIVQHELIFSEEGLTLLTIDHVYTFKQLLRTLSKKDWVPHAREVCLSSCVHLLQRINEIYTDPKISRGYVARVYKDIDFSKESYKEVISAYDLNYCTASIKDITTLEPDYTALSVMEQDLETDSQSETEPTPVAELPDSSPQNPNEDLISPVDTVDLSLLDTWQDPYHEESFDVVSPLTVKYPTITRHSEIPESPLDPDAPWISAVPPPLKTKRASTMPNDISQSRHEAETRLVNRLTPLDPMKTFAHDMPALSKTCNTKSLEDPISPLESVKVWIESWSTAAPRVLCENCHEVVVEPLLPRRFTVA